MYIKQDFFENVELNNSNENGCYKKDYIQKIRVNITRKERMAWGVLRENNHQKGIIDQP